MYRVVSQLLRLTLLLAVASAVSPPIAVALDVHKTAEALASRAAKAFESGNMTEAATLYREAYHIDASQSAYLYGAARAAHTGRDLEHAEQDYVAFLALPDADPARGQKAKGYLEKLRGELSSQKSVDAKKAETAGDALLAATLYLEAWRMAPDQPEPLLKAAILERSLGDKKAAIENLLKYLQLARREATGRGTAEALLKELGPASAPVPPISSAIKPDVTATPIASPALPPTAPSISVEPWTKEDVEAAIARGKGSFHPNSNGTVTQVDGPLVWQKGDSGDAMDWEAAAPYCARLALAGLYWRLPKIEELVRLVDRSRSQGQRTDAAFDVSGPRPWYWSATMVRNSPFRAWYVFLDYGTTDAREMSYPLRVRCVSDGRAGKTGANSAPQATADASSSRAKGTFIANLDGTVSQTDAKLVWEKGHSEDGFRWADAPEYCAQLTLAGGQWRLPSVQELVRLIDVSRYEGRRIDAAFGDHSETLWTSSREGKHQAWRVNFESGDAYPLDPSGALRVRCVRNL